MIELDFNATLKQHDCISISSMKTFEGKRSVALGMAQSAAELGKKVLYVSMDDRALPTNNKINSININKTVSDWQLPNVFDALLAKWKSDYDLVFIQNVEFKNNANSLLALRSSDLNLFVLDSRLSKLNYVTEVDDVIQKMNLKNFYYLVNRGGYSPSILSKVKNIFKWTKQIKTKK
jgi:Mrp family chromosome partitioning ATPase